ncbi:MAG: ribbon-helix-helix domain-containing protein [Planctomycetota bacterium]|jgi:Arc/MetJ-type ribon-helix-helix transcriptional regulator|nr:ribbon-helix-helix domain-containing protein [Planctomycetota bacterium]MDP6941563.1 ribbon-helix-helix domain-containing protein [Planctomycetota bacterium]
MQKETRVTVKIPRPLYRRIQQVIENTGFSSATDFIVFVMRDLMGEVETSTKEEFTPDELNAIKQKLKNLGYLD